VLCCWLCVSDVMILVAVDTRRFLGTTSIDEAMCCGVLVYG
jgi:hypothetical protein